MNRVEEFFDKVDVVSKDYNLNERTEAEKFCKKCIELVYEYRFEGFGVSDLFGYLKSRFILRYISLSDFHKLWWNYGELKTLDSCPFCGSADLKMGAHYFENSDNWCYWIECCVCGCRTKAFKNKSDAKNAWNRRYVGEELIE